MTYGDAFAYQQALIPVIICTSFLICCQLQEIPARRGLECEVLQPMELVVRKSDLLKELSLLQGIVERKNTIPILANVLLERDEGSASRCSRPISTSACAAAATRTVSKPGIADAAGEETVRDRQRAAGHRDSDRGRQGRQERDGRGRSLRVADADAAGGRVSDAAAGRRARRKRRCPGAALKRMISHTRFAITSEDTRYFLNGAQLVLRPDSMSMVATDGHRLAFISVHGIARQEREVRSAAAAQDAQRSRAAHRRRRRDRVFAGREPPVFPGRRPAADLAQDRRELPGLRARDSEDQRQAASNSIAIGSRPRCGACGCSRTSDRKP